MRNAAWIQNGFENGWGAKKTILSVFKRIVEGMRGTGKKRLCVFMKELKK